jgi:hypothetical protein
VLVTTWKTPTGWLVVADALTMGPCVDGGHDHAAHAAAADDDADHISYGPSCSTARRGRARGARLRLRQARRVDARRGDATGRRDRFGPDRHLAQTSRWDRGDRSRAHVLERRRAYCRSRGRKAASPETRRQARRVIGNPRASGAAGSRRRHPDHRFRDPSSARPSRSRASATCPPGDGCRAHHIAPRDPRR